MNNNDKKYEEIDIESLSSQKKEEVIQEEVMQEEDIQREENQVRPINPNRSGPNIANLQILLDRAVANNDFDEAKRLNQRINFYKNQGYDTNRPQNYNARPQNYNTRPQTYNNVPQNYNSRPQTYNNVPQTYNARPQSVSGGPEGYFDGYLIQMIGWNILSAFVTIISLGILYPVAVTWKLKWKCKHTVYDGKRLYFDGNGMQLLGKWIVWMLLTAITFTIYMWFIPIRMEKWKAKHTHLVDDR